MRNENIKFISFVIVLCFCLNFQIAGQTQTPATQTPATQTPATQTPATLDPINSNPGAAVPVLPPTEPVDPPRPPEPPGPIGPIDPTPPVSEKCYYPDMDGDTFGDANAEPVCVKISENIPDKHVDNNKDCDDDNEHITVGQFVFYKDHDGDGFGGQKASDILESCQNIIPEGYVTNNRDINDFTEPCDFPCLSSLPPNDCPGLARLTLYIDRDRDGHGSGLGTPSCVSVVEGYSSRNDDCDDDNPDVTTKRWYRDQDNDGFGDPKDQLIHRSDSDWNVCSGLPGYVNNNLDQCPEEYGLLKGCVIEDAEEDFNTVRSLSFDINGKLISGSKAYFDDLGKGLQTQSYDTKTNRVWATQTIYDKQGRSALQTLPGTIREKKLFEYKSGIIKKTNGKVFTESDLGTLTTDPAPVGNAANTIGWYYSNLNTIESLQDVTSRPYSRSFYSELNPGTVLKTVGGNKINGTWRQGYSFTMAAAQELSQVGAFDDPKYSNYQVLKTVVRDVHGIESVVFTDTDGNTLAAARSGNQEKSNLPSRTMSISIGTQGYVDIHIPVGCTGISVEGYGASLIVIHNLITEEPVDSDLSALTPGFYRVSIPDWDQYPQHETYVKYKENYYDYSLNEYDKAGRLIRSQQPLNKLETIYKYNSLGQLLYTSSPDEGKAWFLYRKDGQIRFSTNTKQLKVKQFSYTNYDHLGRPIESGVFTDGNHSYLNSFATTLTEPFKAGLKSLVDVADGLVDSSCSEQQKTTYDAIETGEINTLPAGYRTPSFLASNVAKTSNENTTTYYSYDIYGRVKWIVQDIKDIGFKTIDYTYDPITSQVTLVDYQKNSTTDRFVHRYSYDVIDHSLIKVETSINGTKFEEHAAYKYYETGALKRLILAEGLQGIDYVYNLQGALKSINHPSLSPDNDPGGDANDVFGMIIDYHDHDYSRPRRNIKSAKYGKNQYNGNIKGIRWNNRQNKANGGKEFTFGYRYDRNNWLREAEFGEFAPDYTSLPTITSEHNPYTKDYDDNRKDIIRSGESLTISANKSITLKPGFHAQVGGTFNTRLGTAEIRNSNAGTFVANSKGDYKVSGITYDANGNIQSLNRNKHTANGKNEMDQLSYNYKKDKPNQLLRVDDAVIAATDADDIKDQYDENYVYNDIGQLIYDFENVSKEDKDKFNNQNTIPEDLITYFYNASGLVTKVNVGTAPLIEFFYNDKNQRVRKQAYYNYRDGGLPYVEHYVRDASGTVMAIYRDSKVLEHTIYGASRLGVYKRQVTGASPYFYELTDHLGNVRAVVSKETNETVAIKGATDYYPFGMPMPGRDVGTNQYRYKYQGQEKDPETGKEAFEARLWDARIGRWLTIDPAREFYSPYLGMGNNPLSTIDPDGRCTKCPKNAKIGDTYNHSEYGNLTFDEQGWADGNGVNIMNDVLLTHTPVSAESPILQVNFQAMPVGMEKMEFLQDLKTRLVENGFNKDVQVVSYSIVDKGIFASAKRWWYNTPGATLLIKNYNPKYDIYNAGGYAVLGSNVAKVYNGLGPTLRHRTTAQSIQRYVSTSMHEIGHAVFSFSHDINGHTNDPNSIMDYRSNRNDPSVKFSPNQIQAIRTSVWGN